MKNIKIYNLSTEICKSVHPKIADNAKDLQEISKVAFERKKIGVAVSLNILSLEEYTKATIVLLKSEAVKVFEVKELRQAFTNHKKKHETATLLEIINLVEPVIKFAEWNERRLKRKHLPFIERFVLNIQDFSNALEPLKQIISNIQWLDNADSLKNRGLYVDYSEKLLIPSGLRISDYERADLVCRRIKTDYRLLNIAFNRLKETDKIDFIKTLNQGIDTYNKNNE